MKQAIKKYGLIALVMSTITAGVWTLAGVGTISDAVPGTTIFASDFNKITGALKVDLVPRNSSGIATAEGGSLGSSTYPWDALYFGASASGLSLNDSTGNIVLKTANTTRVTISSTGLSLDSLADGLITWAKLNADAKVKLNISPIVADGTFVVPATNVTNIMIVGCGGGGGGGGGGLNIAANNTSGGGGGAGGMIGVVFISPTPGETLTIDVGPGGAGGAGAGSAGATATAGTAGTATTLTYGAGTLTWGGGAGGPGGDDIAISGAAKNYQGGGASSAGGGGSTAGVFGTPSAGEYSSFALGGAAGANGASGTGGGGGGGGLARGGAGGAGTPANGSNGSLCSGGGGGGGSTATAPGTGGTGGNGAVNIYYVSP